MKEKDWISCQKAATQLLLDQPALSFPIEPQQLKTKQDIYFDSFQGYCYTVNLPISSLCCHQIFHDGCTVFSSDPSFFLVLYNEWDFSKQRRRFTLAHELGHILLSHSMDDEYSETLANCFASHLLIPRIALNYLIEQAHSIRVREFSSFFGVSSSAIYAAYRNPSSSCLFGQEELLCKLRPQLELFCRQLSEPIISV